MRNPRAADIMTAGPITVTGDTSTGDVARILAEQHISGVPVVDGPGAVIGVITEADLLVKSLRGEDLRSRLDFRATRR